jgi:hypothetical protein
MKTSRLMASLLSVLLTAGTVSIMSGCGSSSSSSSAASTSFAGTQPPGDFWSWTINDSSGTFTAANTTQNLNYSGSVSGLTGNSAGIWKLSITSTTDPSLTAPSSAYAVEIPSTALLVAAGSIYNDVSGNQDSIRSPVFAIAQGSCPSTGANLNWITMPPASWCPTAGANSPLGNGCASADDAYGTAVITVSGGTYGISVTPYQLDGTPGSGAFDLSGCTCTNGLIQCTDADHNPVRIAFTPSGFFFVDTPSNALAGIVQPDSNIDLTDFLNAKTFKGLWYTSLDSSGIFNTQSECTAHGGTWISGTGCGTHTTQPIFAATDGTQLTGHPYSNIDNGTASLEGGAINFTSASQPVPGLIKATFTSACGGPTSDIVLAVRKVNNKYVGLILTHSPCTTFDVGFNVMVIEQ